MIIQGATANCILCICILLIVYSLTALLQTKPFIIKISFIGRAATRIELLRRARSYKFEFTIR